MNYELNFFCEFCRAKFMSQQAKKNHDLEHHTKRKFTRSNRDRDMISVALEGGGRVVEQVAPR